MTSQINKRRLAPSTASFQWLQWKWFLALPLLPLWKDIVVKYIFLKLPYIQRLHRFNPTTFTTSICPICSLETEDAQHMLFTCPKKQPIWQKLIHEFLWPTVTTADISSALYALDFSSVRYCQKSITGEVAIFIALSQIWRQHYRSIFDNQVFDVHATYKTVQYAISTEIQRSKVSSEE